MNKIKIPLLFILLLSLFTTFTSCNGRNNTKTLHEITEIGLTGLQIDPTIWAIYQDKKHQIIGSEVNRTEYSIMMDSNFKEFHCTHDGLVSNEIRGFQEDSMGNIFIETERGVNKFDGQTFQTLQIANPESPTNDWRFRT
jgi:hypothetical protein